MSRFAYVVSAENNHYMVWQAMLFHYSCLTVTGQAPVIMVHGDGEPLLDGFTLIERYGGRIQQAPNYRWNDGVHYPPRNTAASLLHVDIDADVIVLCDPDMIFLHDPALDRIAIDDDQVSFDRLTYLDLDRTEFRELLEQVCSNVGVPVEALEQTPINGGVPHLVPRGVKESLAHEWMAMIAAFPADSPYGDVRVNVPHINWMSTMWAVVLAVHRLGLRPMMTELSTTNWKGEQILGGRNFTSPSMIHYCYPQEGFNKQIYDKPDCWEDVWRVPAGDATLSGQIRTQIECARRWYGL